MAGLYDVEADPREQHDLQAAFPELVKQLLHKLLLYNASVALSIHQPSDPLAKNTQTRLAASGRGALCVNGGNCARTRLSSPFSPMINKNLCGSGYTVYNYTFMQFTCITYIQMVPLGPRA